VNNSPFPVGIAELPYAECATPFPSVEVHPEPVPLTQFTISNALPDEALTAKSLPAMETLTAMIAEGLVTISMSHPLNCAMLATLTCTVKVLPIVPKGIEAGVT
jgi:hypothetical protein